MSEPTLTGTSADAGIEQFADTKVLVTGATGFIGGHLVEKLHQRGANVHAIARRKHPTTSFDTPVTWHRADLTDAEETIRTVAEVEPEHIIHLASLVKGAREPDLLLPMFQSNLASTAYVLEGARLAGVRRVQLAGSMEEPSSGVEQATSPYALSKTAAHMYGDYYQAATDVEVVNLQIFMTYGPAQFDEKKLVPYVIRKLESHNDPELSSGERKVDWVYVGDVAEGMVRCCMVDEVPWQAVPLGTGVLHTVREVVETLIDLAGTPLVPDFGSRADRTQEVVRSADIEVTQDILDWMPDTSLRDGLRSTLDWYRANRP